MVSVLQQVIFGNTIYQYLFFFTYIVLGIIGIKVLSWLFNTLFKPLEEKIKKYEVIFGILRRPEPILLIIFVSIIRGALNVLYVNVKLLNIIDKLIFVLYVSFGAWFLGKAAIIIIEKYLSRFTEDTTEQKRYDHLLPLIRTLVKVFIILIGMLLIISNFGYDVTGLVAGLGIGGVAIAFASRELLENFFSGIIIFTEKQFKVGDIVKSEEISGTITEINIRTSKIESFDGTVYIVPNSKLSQGIVENISKRKARRVIENVSLSHENSFEKIEKAKEIIKNLLHNNKKINDRDSYVIFDKFNTQTIELYFDYWVKEKDWTKFLEIKDELHCEIKKQFEKEGIKFIIFKFS